GFAALFLIWLIGAEAPVSAGMNVNVNIGVPAVVVSEPPEMVMVPNSRVYFAPNVEADLFFYRGGWYSHRGDRWFRAGSYEGPWVVVAPGAVPVEIVRVPRSYRTVYVREEHVPYGHLKRHWKMREREKHAWKEHKHRYKPDRDEDDD
ncbi:MAG: hypothetical protein HZA60_08865, partial [Deltaproteobacteria bacterium]|nr:hypothetical protein [Deltaproteobacteria bacterium]